SAAWGAARRRRAGRCWPVPRTASAGSARRFGCSTSARATESPAGLAALGMRPVIATDLEPAAREAALRDRPDVYDAYLITDLVDLSPTRSARSPSWRPTPSPAWPRSGSVPSTFHRPR